METKAWAFLLFLRDPQCARCVHVGALHMCVGNTYIILGLEQSVKVFSAISCFVQNVKVFGYTVTE